MFTHALYRLCHGTLPLEKRWALLLRGANKLSSEFLGRKYRIKESFRLNALSEPVSPGRGYPFSAFCSRPRMIPPFNSVDPNGLSGPIEYRATPFFKRFTIFVIVVHFLVVSELNFLILRRFRKLLVFVSYSLIRNLEVEALDSVSSLPSFISVRFSTYGCLRPCTIDPMRSGLLPC